MSAPEDSTVSSTEDTSTSQRNETISPEFSDSGLKNVEPLRDEADERNEQGGTSTTEEGSTNEAEQEGTKDPESSREEKEINSDPTFVEKSAEPTEQLPMNSMLTIDSESENPKISPNSSEEKGDSPEAMDVDETSNSEQQMDVDNGGEKCEGEPPEATDECASMGELIPVESNQEAASEKVEETSTGETETAAPQTSEENQPEKEPAEPSCSSENIGSSVDDSVDHTLDETPEVEVPNSDNEKEGGQGIESTTEKDEKKSESTALEEGKTSLTENRELSESEEVDIQPETSADADSTVEADKSEEKQDSVDKISENIPSSVLEEERKNEGVENIDSEDGGSSKTPEVATTEIPEAIADSIPDDSDKVTSHDVDMSESRENDVDKSQEQVDTERSKNFDSNLNEDETVDGKSNSVVNAQDEDSIDKKSEDSDKPEISGNDIDKTSEEAHKTVEVTPQAESKDVEMSEKPDDTVELKISSVTSGGDTDSGEKSEAKKPMLKLASFADLGSNGIADEGSAESVSVGSCAQCLNNILGYSSSLMWETMIFCNATCLADYQEKLSHCSTCKKTVLPSSLGKYCVRFGADIKQFCSNVCLEDHKKGLKVCSYCQKDISGGEGFLAPIGDKGQFKDFCVQDCLKKYEALHCGKTLEKESCACAVCSQEKPVEVELLLSSDRSIKLCSAPCLSAYKFGNGVDSFPCDLCKKEIDSKNFTPIFKIYYNGKTKRFCCISCQNVFVIQNREIVPCNWCKVKKYNFDMIEQVSWDGDISTSTHFCSVNCYKLNAKVPATSSTQQRNVTQTLSSASVQTSAPQLPVIQSVSSLAGAGEPPARPDRLPTEPVPQSQIQNLQPQIQVQTQTITQTVKETLKETVVKLPEAVEVKNKATMAKPFMHTKGVSCRPHPCHKSTQTDMPSVPALAPVGVPLYTPVPTVMYQKPYPVPVPVPIPIPVPIFIPTTRNSIRGIMKQIKKIRSKLPADPFEAELLAMAGALVDKDKHAAGGDEDSDDSVYDDRVEDWTEDYQINDSVIGSIPAPDLESDIKGGRVVPKPLPQVTPDLAPSPQPFGYNRQQGVAGQIGGNVPARVQPQVMRGQPIKRRYSSRDEGDDEDDENSPWRARQSKAARGGRGGRPRPTRTEIMARETSSAIASIMSKPPEERPDAKHHLKFTYGVNAWKHWVVGKNAELEKARAQGRYMKAFETDLLKLRADELNYTLCMFVKEVKKPNGDAYAADSIFYLTLGIQEYLFENGRIDNIFMDTYYEPFTSALHDVIKEFRLPVNEHGYFVTRIEEEHLWESKQLGAHSPQVLLNTLVYFNTKYFMLRTADEHAKLSFAHIMKHWKKGSNAPQTGAKAANNSPGSQGRSVLLRYYPPPNKLANRHDDRKCYEQHENSDIPLRCPVKLYEFYLSKCPESMKSRSDAFYLQPERSCVPDSPVWYSTSPLSTHQLDKMLQRILMVREVQEHMLADAS